MEETVRGNGTVSVLFNSQGVLEICAKNDRDVSSYGIFSGDNPFDFALPATLFQIIIIIVVSQTLYFLLKPLRTPKFICNLIVSSNILTLLHSFHQWITITTFCFFFSIISFLFFCTYSNFRLIIFIA